MNKRPEHDVFIGDASLDLQASLTDTLSNFLQTNGADNIHTQERDYATPTERLFVHNSEQDLHRLNTHTLEHFKNTIAIAQDGISMLTAGDNTPANLIELAQKINDLNAEIQDIQLDQNHVGATMESLIELQQKITETLDPMFQEMAVVSDTVPANAADDATFSINIPETNGSILVNGSDVQRIRKIIGETPITDQDTDLKYYTANAVEVSEMLQGLQELRYLEDNRFILNTLTSWDANNAQEISDAFAQRDLNANAAYDFAHALRMIEKMPAESREIYQQRAVSAFVQDDSELAFDNGIYATLSNATKADHFNGFMNAALRNDITMSTLLTLGAKVTEQPAVLLENINPSLRARLDSLPTTSASLIFEQPGGNVENLEIMSAETEQNLFEALKQIRSQLDAPNEQPKAHATHTASPTTGTAIATFDLVWNETYNALADMIDIAYPSDHEQRRDLTARIDGASQLYNRLMSAMTDPQTRDELRTNPDQLTRYRRQVVNAVRVMRDVAQSPALAEARTQLAHEFEKTRALPNQSVVTEQRLKVLDAHLGLLESRSDLINELENAGTVFLFRQARENPMVNTRRGALYEQLTARLEERQDQDAAPHGAEQRKQIVTRLLDEIHSDQDVVSMLGGLRVSYILVNENSSKELRKIVEVAAKKRDALLEHADNRWQHEQFTAAVAAQQGELSWLANKKQNRQIRKANKARAKVDAGLIDTLKDLSALSVAYSNYTKERNRALEAAVSQAQAPAPQVEQPQEIVQPKRSEHAERLANFDRALAQPIVDADGRTLVEPQQIEPAELERRKRSMAAAMRSGGTAPESTTVGELPEWLKARELTVEQSMDLPSLPEEAPLPRYLQRAKDEMDRQSAVDDQVLPVTADDRILPPEQIAAPRRKRSIAQNLNTRARATARKLRNRSAQTAAIAEAPAMAAFEDSAPKVGMPTKVKGAIGAVLVGAKGDLAWAGNALGSLGRIAPGIVVGAASGMGVRLATGALAAAAGSILLTGAPLVAVTLVSAMVVGRYMGRGNARFSHLNRESMKADNSWKNAFTAPVRNLAQTIKENFNGTLKEKHTEAKDKFGDLMNDAYAEVKQREANGKQTRTAKTLNKVMFYPRLWSAASRQNQEVFAMRVGTSLGMWSAAAGALVTHALMASPVDLPAGVDQWNVHEVQADKLNDLANRAHTQISTLLDSSPDQPATIETPVIVSNEPGKLITERLPSVPGTVITTPEPVVTIPEPVITSTEPVITVPEPVITVPADSVITETAPVITTPDPVVSVAGNTNVTDFVQTDGMQKIVSYWEGLLSEKGKIPTSLKLTDGTTINPRQLIEQKIAGARAGNLTDATALMDYTSEGGVFDKRGVFGDLRRIGPRVEDVLDVKKDLVTRFGESADPNHKWNVEHTRKFMSDMEARVKVKAPKLRPTMS